MNSDIKTINSLFSWSDTSCYSWRSFKISVFWWQLIINTLLQV